MAKQLGEPPVLRGRALTILGSAYRTVGNLDEANRIFALALEFYESLEPDQQQLVLDKADLWRRLAYLRMQTQRFSEALELVRDAADIYVAAQDRHELGRVLAAKGLVQLQMKDPAAIKTLGQALAHIDADKNLNAYNAATHNLLFALCTFQPKPEILEAVLDHLAEARVTRRSRRPSRRPAGRRQPLGRRRQTVADATARFLRGRILLMLGQHEDARKLLETAREDFIALGLPVQTADVSVDLAECYLWLPDYLRWPRIERLATEALVLLEQAPSAPEALAAYRLLHRASQTRSERQARRQLGACRQQLRCKPEAS